MLLATGTFAAGFGMMNCLYWAEAPTLERGLYTYWSATLGDAVALPILVGALAEADARLADSKPVPLRVGMVALVLGAAAGLASQVAWLADNDPDPNWTIPKAHTFTVAGYYHAGFTVATAGLVAVLAARVAWAMNEHRLAGVSAGGVRKLLALSGVATIGFVLMAVADNVANSNRGASLASLVALGLGALAIAGLTVWVRRGSPRH